MATSAAMPDVYGQPAHPVTCPSLTVCYVAATTGEIRKSSDGGATWPAQTTGTAPLGAVTFPAISLAGSLTSTATGALTVDDESAARAGWSLSATSTTFTNGGHTLPTTATTITGVTDTPQGGACVAPANTMTYPITLPAAAIAPTAAKFYSTPDDTGTGPVDLAPAFSLVVPANARAGTYTSTWTVTISSGP